MAIPGVIHCCEKASGDMSDLFWLSDAQMARLKPFFPKPPRVDDRRVLSGIIFLNRNGLHWRDAPKEYGPHKTLYNRWKRWSEKGIFARMLLELAEQGGETDTLMIDATHLKAHRTASSLELKKGVWASSDWPNQRRVQPLPDRRLKNRREERNCTR